MAEAVYAALLDRVETGTRESPETKGGVSTPVLLTVPYPRRAVDYRYGMRGGGAREYFCPGYGRLRSEFEEQDRGQERRVSEGYHHGDPTCMWYRCDSLPRPEPGTVAIDLQMATIFLVVVRAKRFAVSAIADLRACQRRCASSSQSWPSSGFKQPLAEMKGCLQCSREWMSSWRLRQNSVVSRKASARGERRPLQRRRSFFFNEALTTNTSA